MFIVKNQGIVFGEAKMGVPLGVLNLRYKLYVLKHGIDIVPHNIPYFNDVTLETNSLINDDHVHEEVEAKFMVSHVKVYQS